MALKEEMEAQVRSIVKTNWKRRQGTVVPPDTSVTLGNDAVELDATVLYADLADSTKLVDGYKDWFAAEIYKSFLYCAARIILAEGGTITAYDGDRVMAVYLGDTKNTAAVRTAMKINWAVKHLVQPAIKAKYPNVSYILQHVCGVDTSKLIVAKTGVRGSNDLVWVGRAANYAAKLAALDHSKPTWITEAIYNTMRNEVKYHQQTTDMWIKHTWNAMNNIPIYASTYLLSIP
jgi:class 3 adenylate cyclase